MGSPGPPRPPASPAPQVLGIPLGPDPRPLHLRPGPGEPASHRAPHAGLGVPRCLSLSPRSLEPFLGADLACTPAMRTQGPRSPPQANAVGTRPAHVGLPGRHLGLGGEAGDPWGRSRCSWAAAEVGSQASMSLPGLFLACEPGMARPSSSPGTQRCLLSVATPDPARSPAGRPAPGDGTARERTCPAGPGPWLATHCRSHQTPTSVGQAFAPSAQSSGGRVSDAPGPHSSGPLPTGAGVQAVPDPCQPCPAGHGASVPGGRGRSRQDPEALHPEGPALSLSFPPHSRKNRDQRTQDTGTEEGLETQQKTRGDPSSLGRAAPGRDVAREAATHTCRQFSVHGGVTRDACPRPYHLTPGGEEMTGMGERQSRLPGIRRKLRSFLRAKRRQRKNRQVTQESS